LSDNQWIDYLIQAAPFLLIVGFWVLMMRQMQGGRIGWISSAKRRGVASDLDALLVESERRAVEPKAPVAARLLMAGNQTAEGRIVWADTHFIKLQTSAGGPAVVVPKRSILKIESVPH
jgi:hypothetical protein